MSKKNPEKDPFGYVVPKQCRYCPAEPVVAALVQKVPDKPEAVYLCQYHLENPPASYTVLNSYPIGGKA